MSIPAVVAGSLIDPTTFGNAVADELNRQIDRPRCILRPNAATSIPNATNSSANWQVELADTDGFHTGTSPNIVIPAGLGGLYYFGYAMNVDTAGGTISFWLDAATTPMGTRVAQSAVNASAGAAQGHAVIPVEDGDSLYVGVYQTTGVARNVNTNNDGFFIAIRLGD